MGRRAAHRCPVRVALGAGAPVAPPDELPALPEDRPIPGREEGPTVEAQPPAPVFAARARLIAARQRDVRPAATAVRAQQARPAATAVRPTAKAARVRGRIEAMSPPAEPDLLPGEPGCLAGRPRRSAGPRSKPLRAPVVASRPTAVGIGRRPGGTAQWVHDVKAAVFAARRAPKVSLISGLSRARSAVLRRLAATCGPGRRAPRVRSNVGRREISTTHERGCPVRRAARVLALVGRLLPAITTDHL
jgi:hypothetical protein